VAAVFPDALFHAGGDEVSTACWSENKEVAAWMVSHNMGVTGLNNYYAMRLFDIVRETMHKAAMVWWPGIADTLNVSAIPRSTILDVYGGPEGYNASAAMLTAAGLAVVRSAGYYLDQLCEGDPDGKHDGTYWGYFDGWTYYARDPVEGPIATQGNASLILGGKVRPAPGVKQPAELACLMAFYLVLARYYHSS